MQTASNTATDLLWMVEQARTPRRRSMRTFAEDEIVIPDGPFEGRKFRCSRQPYTGLWLDGVDSGRWPRYVATGPTQSGKTLCCFVIPLLYHLFEVGETVICGLPDMDMAADKWREDILPAIERSKFRDLLPTHGGGSRGGKVESIQFANGATLKFMSGGGSDKSRAGFTSRVVVVTETDGLDESGGRSREADKITQLEARTRAYGSRKRIYLECTVSTEDGRTWREYQESTRSRIVLCCPHCREWVSPEREHLTGWKQAESQQEAREAAAFGCPACGALWTEEDRIAANEGCRLLFENQQMDADGRIHGDAPATDTFGFRWSAVHNLFLTAGDVAADEWRAARSPDEENAEREMRQFVWCLPALPLKLDQTSLQVMELTARTADWPRGIVPTECEFLTAAIDLGKYLAHWIIVAWMEDATSHVADYGRIEIASDDLGVEQAIMVALRQFRDQIASGWPMGGEGKIKRPELVWLDAGYMTDVVYEFCRKEGRPFYPSVGRGVTQQRNYSRPSQTGSVIQQIGQGFHVSRLASEKVQLIEVDADHWKTWAHQRLSTPIGTSGSMTFFHAPPEEHLALAKHLTAERKTEEFVAGRGVVVRWERVRRQNHWFDALYNACAAGYACGVRLVGEKPKLPPRGPRRIATGIPRRDGRPWFRPGGWRE